MSQHRWRFFSKLALLVLFIFAANYFSHWLGAQLDFEVTPRNEAMVHQIIIASAVLYAILIAIPFVPGVEIGLALMLILGADLAPLLYLFTLVGLGFSFFVGRLIPQVKLKQWLANLSLTRASELVAKLEPLDMEQRLNLLVAHAPARFIPLLLRHRYIAVAITLNIPGNAIIGGGGGISMLAGISRLFGGARFLLTLAVAVAPLPLLILIYGTDMLH